MHPTRRTLGIAILIVPPLATALSFGVIAGTAYPFAFEGAVALLTALLGLWVLVGFASLAPGRRARGLFYAAAVLQGLVVLDSFLRLILFTAIYVAPRVAALQEAYSPVHSALSWVGYAVMALAIAALFDSRVLPLWVPVLLCVSLAASVVYRLVGVPHVPAMATSSDLAALKRLPQVELRNYLGWVQVACSIAVWLISGVTLVRSQPHIEQAYRADGQNVD